MRSSEIRRKHVLPVDNLKTCREQILEDEYRIEDMIFHLRRPGLIGDARDRFTKNYTAVGFERLQDMPEDGHPLWHLVISIQDNHAIQRTNRQMRVVFNADNNLDIRDSGIRQALASYSKYLP